jgi:hypothetical protein
MSYCLEKGLSAIKYCSDPVRFFLCIHVGWILSKRKQRFRRCYVECNLGLHVIKSNWERCRV